MLVRALVEQASQQIQGRAAQIESAWMRQPESVTVQVIERGRFVDPAPEQESSAAWLRRIETPFPPEHQARNHTLTFRSPLLLASRGAVRSRLPVTGQLPWPTLGSVLDSIARRIRVLEPELARALGVGPAWRVSAAAQQSESLTPAADPAKQVVWTYTAVARQQEGRSRSTDRRSLSIPGIVGTLVFPSSGDPVEYALLYWGQWLGLGQKTTMGCGSYVLNSI